MIMLMKRRKETMYRLFLILNLDYCEAKIVYHWIKNKQCYLKNKKTDASYFLPRSITEPFFVNDQRLKIDSMLLCVLCGEFRHTCLK